ncbi:hypothetical protein EDD15DRAFT_2532024 [Pisolithus albus]|nr:hypothetical protein EDD15DRAFT_2532024 [Pisolithus albus]
MPQQVEHATVMTLDSITEDDVDRKLVVAGRMPTYDPESAHTLLYDTSSALLSGRPKNPNVDHSWALQRKSYVWVVGYLERADDPFPIPIFPAPDINPSIYMRALIISPAKDLDAVRTTLTAMPKRCLQHPTRFEFDYPSLVLHAELFRSTAM